MKDMEKALRRAIQRAVTRLPSDVVEALERALEGEEGAARVQLDTMLENAGLAGKEGKPICQDTGLLSFYVTAGRDSTHLDRVLAPLENVIIELTDEVPLRHNTIDPLTGSNPGDNTGPFMPMVDVTWVEGDEIIVDVLPKGGGSENATAIFMLNPAEGIEKAKQCIMDHIAKVGAMSCPPIILGIGLGSPADLALRLAKRSLIRPLGLRHPDPGVAALEEEILAMVNRLGIGPMGLGGRTTALDVHIEYANRHPASYPVALAVQCWCDRRARLNIDAHGNVEVSQ